MRAVVDIPTRPLSPGFSSVPVYETRSPTRITFLTLNIYPDDVLVIPRSRLGYERLLRRLNSLRKDIATDNTASKGLKQIKSQADKTSKVIDLTADVLTLFVGVGLKCAKLVKAGAVASDASKIVLRKAVEQQHEIAIDITKDFGKFVSGKTVDAVADGMTENETYKDAAGKVHTGLWDVSKAKELGSFVKTGEAQKMGNVLKMEKTVFRGAAKGGVALLHVADILLDFVTPSWIAKKITGYDAAMKEAEDGVKSSKAEMLKILGDRIETRRAEMELVWPSK